MFPYLGPKFLHILNHFGTPTNYQPYVHPPLIFQGYKQDYYEQTTPSNMVRSPNQVYRFTTNKSQLGMQYTSSLGVAAYTFFPWIRVDFSMPCKTEEKQVVDVEEILTSTCLAKGAKGQLGNAKHIEIMSREIAYNSSSNQDTEEETMSKEERLEVQKSNNIFKIDGEGKARAQKEKARAENYLKLMEKDTLIYGEAKLKRHEDVLDQLTRELVVE
uniref:No apical meristem-associated C-terminal domain-containing protein n=1 Tax=Oryza punctata TaxID=4537 RepID=A0A0E0JZM6_ORYPU